VYRHFRWLSLANIREVEAVVFVLRAFVDDDVPGPSDPLEHLRIVELELALADLETVESRVARVQKAAKNDRGLAEEAEALAVCARRACRRSPPLPRRPLPCCA
jgi:ribosome-binding ATPase YchF (GTP1/OBG family)